MNRQLGIFFLSLFSLGCLGKEGSRTSTASFDETPWHEVVLRLNTNARKAIVLDSMLSSVQRDSFISRHSLEYLMSVYAHPSSPMRDEVVATTLLWSEISSPWFSHDEKKKAFSALRLLKQNTVGLPANDFIYYTADGRKDHLYGIRAPFILIYFYNPECEACKMMKGALLQSVQLQQQIIRKELTVLAIYVDKDISLWQRHLQEQPGNWIQGRDENDSIYKNGIYDIKAIPSLYLLDQKKRVLLKDCTSINEIEEAILGHSVNKLWDHN